jgi:electron transfer flavoprotein beta subunit
LKIIVLVKAVASHLASPAVDADGLRLGGKFGPLVMNEPDEYALEHAVRLQEEFGGTVTLLSVGSPGADQIITKGLAKGAEAAYRVDADLTDSNQTAEALAAAARDLGFDLIIAGVESSDNLASRVGITVAEKLGVPFTYSVREIGRGPSDATLEVAKELGGGVTQLIEVDLPAVISVQACSVPLSAVSVTRLLQSRGKEVTPLAPADLQIVEKLQALPGLRVLEVFRPRKHRAEMIEGDPQAVVAAIMAKIGEYR